MSDILIYDQFKSNVNHNVVVEGKVYKENNISIHVNSTDSWEKGFSGEVYIKVYNAPSETKATEMLRISMKDAKLVSHTTYGKAPMKMTKQLGKQLNSIMGRKSTESKYKGLKVSEAIYKAAKEAVAGKKGIEVKEFPVPDFTKFYTED